MQERLSGSRNTEFHQRTENGKSRYVDLNDFKAQLKCTTTITEEGDELVYDLEAKTFNDLVLITNTPRVLVVLRLPDDEANWMALTTEQLIIKHCAYWISFRGQQPTTNTATTRVGIPKNQMFSPEEYRLACDAHRDRRQINVRGALTKAGKRWLLTNHQNLRVLP